MSEGCVERPEYGIPDDRSRVYCKRHRVPGSANMSSSAGWKIPDGPRGAEAGGWVEAEEDGMGVPVDSNTEKELNRQEAVLAVVEAKRATAFKAAALKTAAAKAAAVTGGADNDKTPASKAARDEAMTVAVTVGETSLTTTTGAMTEPQQPTKIAASVADLAKGRPLPPVVGKKKTIIARGERQSSTVMEIVGVGIDEAGAGKESRKKKVVQDANEKRENKMMSVVQDELGDLKGTPAKKQKTSGRVEATAVENNGKGIASARGQESTKRARKLSVGGEKVDDATKSSAEGNNEEDGNAADETVFVPGRFVFLVPSKKCDRPILVGKIVTASDSEDAPPPPPPPSSSLIPPPTIPVSSTTALLLAQAAEWTSSTVAPPPVAPSAGAIGSTVTAPPASTTTTVVRKAVSGGGGGCPSPGWIHVHWHTPASLRRTDYCRWGSFRDIFFFEIEKIFCAIAIFFATPYFYRPHVYTRSSTTLYFLFFRGSLTGHIWLFCVRVQCSREKPQMVNCNAAYIYSYRPICWFRSVGVLNLPPCIVEPNDRYFLFLRMFFNGADWVAWPIYFPSRLVPFRPSCSIRPHKSFFLNVAVIWLLWFMVYLFSVTAAESSSIDPLFRRPKASQLFHVWLFD